MFTHIPKARPAPVDDRVLASLTQIAIDAQSGNCSPAEAEWLITTCAPLLQELACYRAAAAATAVAGQSATVIALPFGGR